MLIFMMELVEQILLIVIITIIIIFFIIDGIHQCVHALSAIRRTEWKVAFGTPVTSINLQRTANKQFSDLVQMSFSLYESPCFNVKLAS